MGLVIWVRCGGCDYAKSMSIGGLRSTLPEERPWPIFCKGCHSISTSHYSTGPLRCLKCGSDDAMAINHPEIYAGDGEFSLHSWVEEELPTMRKVMRSRRLERSGWRGALLLFGRKVFRQVAYWKIGCGAGPDRVLYEIFDGNYLCPRCRQNKLRFSSERLAIFD
jgi:Zn finger protein HypA/HybF involved in hydrogenase expression